MHLHVSQEIQLKHKEHENTEIFLQKHVCFLKHNDSVE